MTKLFYVSALLVSMCFSVAQAQEADTGSAYKHDVGFNTFFILQGVLNSGETPFTIMYKKYTSDRKAIRFGLSTNLYVTAKPDLPTQPNVNSYSQSNANIRASIGKEFQRVISSKWMAYTGGDLIVTYLINKNEIFQGTIRNNYTKYSESGLTARPFLGIRYHIKPRLYLSVEASLNLKYALTGQHTENVNQGNTETVKLDNRILSLSLQPATGIFLFYRF